MGALQYPKRRPGVDDPRHVTSEESVDMEKGKSGAGPRLSYDLGFMLDGVKEDLLADFDGEGCECGHCLGVWGGKMWS
jgi:hypothetical protein